jgi:hypothetical protein
MVSHQTTQTIHQTPLQQLQQQFRRAYTALKAAKAESDALVAEGRRITGWPEPISFRQKLKQLMAQMDLNIHTPPHPSR